MSEIADREKTVLAAEQELIDLRQKANSSEKTELTFQVEAGPWDRNLKG